MKILVAEDDLVSRKVLVGHLQKWGYEITETANGADAWAAFEAGDFRMAILDWMMPEIDGLELVRRIRQSRRPAYTYVILLTAKSQKDDLVEGIEAGADDYVTKPFDRGELRVRVLAGRRILELQAALLRAEKGASVGQVALGLSQELFQPVGEVRDNLVTLRREALTLADRVEAQQQTEPPIDAAGDTSSQSDSMADLFNSSLETIGRVQHTLRNLKDFAHADQIIMKPISVTPALEDVARMVERLADAKAVDVVLDLSYVPAVNGNAGKLKKMILHLLVNAIEAVDRRGTVTLSAIQENKQVVIRIQDNGRGIAAAHLPHIFEPFYALRFPGDGRVGLGLAISDAIIREHGGTLEVKSIVERGTTFTIRLPALPPEQSVSVTLHTSNPLAVAES